MKLSIFGFLFLLNGLAVAQSSPASLANKLDAALTNASKSEKAQPVQSLYGEEPTRVDAAINQALKEQSEALKTSTLQVPDSAGINEKLFKNGRSTIFDLNPNCTTPPCSASLTVRQALVIPKENNQDFQKVVDAFTADVRSPRDKDAPTPRVTVKRTQYEMIDTAGQKVCRNIDHNDPGKPMDVDQVYTIKKCLDVTGIPGYSCNTFSYKLHRLDAQTYALVTVQTDPVFPQGCDFNKKNINAKDDHQKNAFDGATAVTVIRDDGNTVRIYDRNQAYVAQSSGAKYWQQHQDVLGAIVDHDALILRQKLQEKFGKARTFAEYQAIQEIEAATASQGATRNTAATP